MGEPLLIFRIRELSENQIWYLGNTFVASVIKRGLLARAELGIAYAYTSRPFGSGIARPSSVAVSTHS